MAPHFIIIALFALSAEAALPRLPLTVAPSWPGAFGPVHPGDLRAEVEIPSSHPGGSVDVQVFWRLRPPVNNNPNPWSTALVTDADGKNLTSTTRVQTGACGVISFNASAGSKYYIYALPYLEGGGGASLHFSWLNGSAPTLNASVCDAAMQSAAFVKTLQTRDAFHGFDVMEQVALPLELTELRAKHPQPLLTFPEPRERIVRLLHSTNIQADWAAGPRTQFGASVQKGEYFTFQIGLYANEQVIVSGIEFSDLVGQGGSVLAAAKAFTCFNLEGVSKDGKPMKKAYTLLAEHGGVLWIGLDLPADGAAGKYNTDLKVQHSSGTSIVSLGLTVQDGAPATRDTDIYKMERLRWLNSEAGFDRTVPAPYINLSSKPTVDGIEVDLINKKILVGKSGFPSAVETVATKSRMGKEVNITHSVLSSPLSMQILRAGSSIGFTPKSFQILETAADRVRWTAVSEGSGILMNVSGSTEFDSYSDFKVVFTATEALQLDDIQLKVPFHNMTAKWIAGMGADPAGLYRDLAWKWDNQSAMNSIWLGRAEAGLMIRLKGDGDAWLSPMFDKDDAIIPFIPESWGGVGGVNHAYGANITQHSLVTISGPRKMAAGDSVTFLFDMVATPARPVDLSLHYKNRQIQLGYGIPYSTPQEVKHMGATVMTLHQGIPGEVNGTMVNPYINYPFTPREVDLMKNISNQAWDLGMNMKYYYTIRELSNHVAELFPLLSLEGEVFLDNDPRSIPEKGYCHDWDCHGGDVFLHEHVVTNYTQCWQQGLAGGELDAALCDQGESRWFNYYIEGLRWAARQPPFLTGIYYDGINFDRLSMQRIRRTADSAVSSVKERPNAKFLLDLHTGKGGGTGYQPCILYLTHYAYVDSLWNGEGFRFDTYDPDTWLIEASGLPMGLTGDTLGGGGSPYQAMLFAMTDRNNPHSPSIWNMWDSVGISSMVMIGWWEDDAPVTASASTSTVPTKVTSYVEYGKKTLLTIATWSGGNVTTALNIDWDMLGLSPSAVSATAPDVDGLQHRSTVDLSSVKLLPRGGLFVVLEAKSEAIVV